MAKTKTEVKNEYNNRKYERVALVVKAGDRQRLKEAAAAAGHGSVNKLIIDSVNAAHPGLLSSLDDESRKKKAKAEG